MDLGLTLFILAGLAAWAHRAPFAAGGDAATGPAVLLFAVRHAEKGPGSDPGLTPEGVRRAEALATLLGATELAAIYSTEYRRCRETVAPLAAARGIGVTVVEACDPHGQLAAVRALPPGSAAVICGHANTIPSVITALGGTVPDLLGGMIPESRYDRVHAITLAPGGDPSRTRVHTLRYGEPT